MSLYADQELNSIYEKSLTVFSPSEPITLVEKLKGRNDFLRRFKAELSTPGKHGILYGDRGVGKTSIAELAEFYLNRSTGHCFIVRCSANSTYESIFGDLLKQIGITHTTGTIESTNETKLGSKMGLVAAERSDGEKTLYNPIRSGIAVNPQSLVEAYRELPGALLVIDEFDRVINDEAHTLITDTLKHFSDDPTCDVTVLLVGVAESVGQLLTSHPSISRCIAEFSLPRLDLQSLEAVLIDGFEAVGIECPASIVNRIATLADGFPHFVHLFGLSLTRQCLNQIADGVRVDFKVDAAAYRAALDDVIKSSEESLRKAYEAATETISPGRNMFRRVIEGVAMSQKRDLRATEIVANINSLYSEHLQAKKIRYHLAGLTNGRNHTLQKVRRGIYKFSDPMMRAYVRLNLDESIERERKGSLELPYYAAARKSLSGDFLGLAIDLSSGTVKPERALVVRSLEKVVHVRTIMDLDRPSNLLDFYECPIEERQKNLLFHSKCRVIVRGAAGIGKSSILRFLAYRTIQEESCVPLYLEYRKVGQSLWKSILSCFAGVGISLTQPDVEQLALAGGFRLYLDGLDEVAEEERERTIREITDFAMRFPEVAVVVSTRPHINFSDLSGFELMDIPGLLESQARRIVGRIAGEERIQNFILGEFTDNVAFLGSPLLLFLLASVARSSGSVPSSEEGLYDALFDHFFRRHDLTKGYIRQRSSTLSDKALEDIFGQLCLEYRDPFTLEQAEDVVGFMPFEHEINTEEVLNDLTAVGILIKSDEKYHASLRRIREYGAARAVVRSSNIARDEFYQARLKDWKDWIGELRFLQILDLRDYLRKFALIDAKCALSMMPAIPNPVWYPSEAEINRVIDDGILSVREDGIVCIRSETHYCFFAVGLLTAYDPTNDRLLMDPPQNFERGNDVKLSLPELLKNNNHINSFRHGVAEKLVRINEMTISWENNLLTEDERFGRL